MANPSIFENTNTLGKKPVDYTAAGSLGAEESTNIHLAGAAAIAMTGLKPRVGEFYLIVNKTAVASSVAAGAGVTLNAAANTTATFSAAIGGFILLYGLTATRFVIISSLNVTLT